MTPLQIEILLHFLRHPNDDFPESSDSVDVALMTLSGLNLITSEFVPDLDYRYSITEKGKFYIEALTGVPMPVCKWVMPDGDV